MLAGSKTTRPEVTGFPLIVMTPWTVASSLLVSTGGFSEHPQLMTRRVVASRPRACEAVFLMVGLAPRSCKRTCADELTRRGGVLDAPAVISARGTKAPRTPPRTSTAPVGSRPGARAAGPRATGRGRG